MEKSLFKKTIIFTLIVFFSCHNKEHNSEKIVDVNYEIIDSNINYPVFLQKLVKFYGKHFKVLDSNNIVWINGDTIELQTNPSKTSNELFNNPDIKDQFNTKYPTGKVIIPKDSCFDPGRIRNEDFFCRMYGYSKDEVYDNLDTLNWMGKQVIKVSKINGCIDSLKKINKEVMLLPDSIKEFLNPSAGCFNFRNIAGTERLSCHSFGIAIDINVKYSNYWRWNKGPYKYRNKIPYNIVEIFEKYGFIWGGHWYYYDTMHFEFRPELI
jgi:peptidoglycan L-alanyl-D-glutamate endopeptidase CwlK